MCVCLFVYCCVSHNSFTAPGPVSDLTAGPVFVSVLISWSAPQEPTGLIIAYEITYRVASDDLVRTNTTDLGTSLEIPSLAPLTTVSNISVAAYTSASRGEVTTHDSVVTPEEPPIREWYMNGLLNAH